MLDFYVGSRNFVHVEILTVKIVKQKLLGDMTQQLQFL